MKLNIEKHKSKSEWVEAILNALNNDVETAHNTFGDVNVLLSGGSTPGPLYSRMPISLKHFEHLKIGLVDERFVPITSEFSNEKLLKFCFKSAGITNPEVIGMIYKEGNEVDNLKAVSAAYAPFIERTDIVILGMGNDGHIASIFPEDESSSQIRRNGIIDVFSTRAPAVPKERITCSLELISRATIIYLLIVGEEKLKVLTNSYMKLPVHNILERRSDVKIIYLEK